MYRYIALLRGINVGASGRIRMDALKRLMESAGFSRVVTYIQSGNVLFDSPLSETDAKETIERTLKDNANITTTAELRNTEEFFGIIRNCPFSQTEIEEAQAANKEGESFYVCLLPQAPSEQTLSQLVNAPAQDDRFIISGRTIYLLLRRSIRTSKLALRLQRLFPDMTARNWNTMKKLNELALLHNKQQMNHDV